MPTVAILANANDQYVKSSSATYTTARTGSGLTVGADTTTNLLAGQNFASSTYSCYETFMQFDTSLIAAGSTVSSATLRIVANTSGSGLTNDQFYVLYRSWTSPLTTDQWVPGANLNLLSTVAYRLGTFVANTTYNLTAATGSVTLGGVTGWMATSGSLMSGTAATALTQVYNYLSGNNASTSAPQLTITYTAPASATTKPIVLLGAVARAATW